MSKLHKDHRAKVAEDAVGSRVEIYACLLGCFVNAVTWNDLEYLPKNIDVVACQLACVGVFSFSHRSPNQAASCRQSAHFFPIFASVYGMPVIDFRGFQ